MTLITRLSRLCRADFNAVLDGLEEPGMLLKQAVRDMEEVLSGEDTELARRAEQVHALQLALDESRARLAALDAELSLCLAADKDELARDLVRRKLEAARHEARLVERQQTLCEAQRRLAARNLEHRQRLAALRAQAAVYAGVDGVTREETTAAWQSVAAISESEIEVALLRERQRRAQS